MKTEKPMGPVARVALVNLRCASDDIRERRGGPRVLNNVKRKSSLQGFCGSNGHERADKPRQNFRMMKRRRFL